MVRHGLWPLVPCFTSTIKCIIHKYFLLKQKNVLKKNKCAHRYIYIYTYIHMYICIYVYIYILCIIMYLNSKGNVHFATGGRCWPWSWWPWGSLWWSCSPVTRPSRTSPPFGRGCLGRSGDGKKKKTMGTLQLWPFMTVITGYFYGIIHSINGVFLVLITGISGHKCRDVFEAIFRMIASHSFGRNLRSCI